MSKKKQGSAKLPNSTTADFRESWRRARPDLSMGEFLLGVAFMRIGRILDLNFDRRCRDDHDISGADMRVLFTLRRAIPTLELRPTDLYKALLVSSGAMTKQIDRLNNKGYVCRRPDVRNQGGFLIGLTPEGRAVADYAAGVLATESLLLPASEDMTSDQRKAGEEYTWALLAKLEQQTNLTGQIPRTIS